MTARRYKCFKNWPPAASLHWRTFMSAGAEAQWWVWRTACLRQLHIYNNKTEVLQFKQGLFFIFQGSKPCPIPSYFNSVHFVHYISSLHQPTPTPAQLNHNHFRLHFIWYKITSTSLKPQAEASVTEYQFPQRGFQFLELILLKMECDVCFQWKDFHDSFLHSASCEPNATNPEADR